MVTSKKQKSEKKKGRPPSTGPALPCLHIGFFAAVIAGLVAVVASLDARSVAGCEAAMRMAEAARPNKTAMRELWAEAAQRREQLAPWVGWVPWLDRSCVKEALAKAAFAQLTGTPGRRATMQHIIEAVEKAEKALAYGATEKDLAEAASNRLPGYSASAYRKLKAWAKHRINIMYGAPRTYYAPFTDGFEIPEDELAELKFRFTLDPRAGGRSMLPRFSSATRIPPKEDVHAAAKFIRAHGFLVLEDVLSKDTCRLVREEIDKGPQNEYYMNMENRKHVRFDPAEVGAVRNAVHEFVGNSYDVWKALVGEDADLVELAGFRTSFGAVEQMPHEDVNHMFAGPDVPLYTMFVALQDIEPDMGPVEVWPDTHALRADHLINRAGIREGTSTIPAVAGTIKSGSAVLIDGTVTHRGSRHLGGLTRYVLYTSFAARPGMVPFGSTYALLEHLIGKYTLKDWKLL